MEKIILNANLRGQTGKIASKHLRQQGLIPGIVYKGGDQGLSISLDRKELWKSIHTEAGGNAIITLEIEGGEKKVKKTVIVQELQHDPLTDKCVHVDFHEISLTEKIKVHVPLKVKGEAPGVVEEKGVLNQALWELEVECLPTEIPEHIDVAVGSMAIGDTIHVKDLEIEEKITVINDPEQMVVGVGHPQVEEEAVEEGEEEEGGDEPEVIKKGKKDEEGEASSEQE